MRPANCWALEAAPPSPIGVEVKLSYHSNGQIGEGFSMTVGSASCTWRAENEPIGPNSNAGSTWHGCQPMSCRR
jgi:hypothetical protein